MQKKSILFLLSDSPYRGQNFAESIDAVLVAAVMDQQVTVLLRDQAVFALQPDQHTNSEQQRTVSKMLMALPDYEVAGLYVCSDAITRFGIDTGRMSVPVTLLSTAEQLDLIARQDEVLTGG